MTKELEIALCILGIIILIGLICLLVYIMFRMVKTPIHRKKKIDIIKDNLIQKGATIDDCICTMDWKKAFFIDTKHKRWGIIDSEMNHYITYRYYDLVDYEVYEERKDATISAANGLRRAAIGQMLLGNTGSVIGAETATRIINNAADLTIRIVVSNPNNPHIILNMLKMSNTNTNSSIVRISNKLAYEEWIEKTRKVASWLDFIKNESLYHKERLYARSNHHN